MKRLIVYVQALLIALIFVATGTDAQAQTVLTYDFENYSINHAFGVMSQSGSPTATVADDPVASGNKTLRFTPVANFNNAAVVIPFTLPNGRTLSEYTHVNFRLRMNNGDVGFKTLRIGAYQNSPSGSFVSNSHQSYHITANGGFATGGSQSAWKTFSVPIANTSTFEGTVYLAFGWHTNGDAIWFFDDIELVGPTQAVGEIDPLPNASCLLDSAILSNNFESNDLNDTYNRMGSHTSAEAIVVNDPQTPFSQGKVVRFKPNSGGHSNHGLLIPLQLPSGRTLSEYTSVTFRGRFSDGDVGFKTIHVGAFQTLPAFASYNTSNNIGTGSTSGTSNNWVDISVTTTNSSTISGSFYLYIGLNNYSGNSGATTWYIDDIELVGPGPSGAGACEVEVTGTAGWRLLSFPITGGTLADISDDTAIQGIAGGDHSSFAPNVLIFKEGNSSFATPSHVDTPFGDGYGFALYFFNNSNAGSSPLPVTLSVLGSEPSTHVEVDLNSSGQFTLVGNPFAANFNTGSITAEDGTIQNTISVWNNTGTYIVLDRTDEEEQVVKRFQGFWVQSTDNASSITLPKFGKSTEAGTGYFGKVQDTQSQRGDIRFKLTSETTTDEAIRLSFRENAIIGWDVADASKFVPLLSKYAILSLVGDDVMKSVYSLPYGLEKAHEVEMKLDLVGVSGEFTLGWTGIQTLPEGWTFTLFDYETGESIEMNNESEYVFNASSSVSAKSANEFTPGSPNLLSSDSEGGNRFGIRITPSAPVSVDGNDTMVREMSLDQNYPNPFNPSTQIGYTISESSHVTLRVYDLLGRQVATLVDENRAAGSYKVTFNAAGLSSGVYIYRLESAGQVLTNRMTLLK